MNAEAKDKILARVRKLLNLANNAGATEGERDNAMRMAHATLAKHNLDIAQVEAAGGKLDDEQRGENLADFYGRPWARMVAQAVAELFFCKYLYYSAKRATDTRHIFIGRTSNATTAAELSRFLVESIRREARRRSRAAGEGNAWLRSFCQGAAIAVMRKARGIMLDAAKQTTPAGREVAPTAPGTALVLATVYEREHKANEDWMKQAYGKSEGFRSGRSGKDMASRDAAAEGHAYGSTLQLNRQVGGTSVAPASRRLGKD